MAQERKAAIGFIFLTILIDVIGFGLIIPVIPEMIMQMKNCDLSTASTYGLGLTFVYAFMQFICSPILGNLSDQYGRRPIILFSLFGFSIDYLFLAFAPTFNLFFVGRIIAGITGASFTAASAYIADISTKETRTKNFGMIGAAFGMGFIIGPALGGVIADQFGLRAPFYFSAGLCLLNWLYGFFVLPESLSKENRRKFDWKRANPLGALKQIRKYPSLSDLVIALTLIYIAAHALQSTWNYINIDKFNWNKTTIGLSLALVGLLAGSVQAGLTRYVNPRLGNEKSAYIGMALYAFGMILFALASETWMMFVFLIPYCLGGIAQPALQSIITSKVPANEQGELQGGLNSLISLSSIIGPIVMISLFRFFTKKDAPIHFAGAPYILAACLMTVSALIAYKKLSVDKKAVTPQ